MATILLVEDDPDQLDIRALVLETCGHDVRKAAGPAAALEQAEGAQVAVVDLGLPNPADGASLLAALHERWPWIKLIAMSGWAPDFQRLGVKADVLIEKPYRSQDLLGHIARLSALLFLAVVNAATFPMAAGGEAIAHLELSAPGKDWSAAGREAALATIAVDGSSHQHVMLFAGSERHTYSVFLGKLEAGEHTLKILGEGVVEHAVKVEPAPAWALHAPVLFERKNAIGRFTDVPLLTYCESLTENGQAVLQYTVIFSNEDGGTSTRSLMARWGRTTDIEYVYRAYLKPDGSLDRAIVQGRGHKDLPFAGPFDGFHPLLMPVTDNNMVAGEGPSDIRYQPAPVLADLSRSSREEAMDRHPITWRVMTAELIRENKLRPFGVERGETISDPRNYLYIEANVRPGKAAVAFAVLHADGRYYYSHTGRTRDAIDRDGWVRSTIELPPGTTAAHLRSINELCVYLPKTPSDARCGPVAIEKLFFLTDGMLPGPSFSLPIGSR